MSRRKVNGQAESLPVPRFNYKLSDSDPDDVELSKFIAANNDGSLDGEVVNLSAVHKGLMLSWFRMRKVTGKVPPASVGYLAASVNAVSSAENEQAPTGPAPEPEMDANDWLVKKMSKGLNLGALRANRGN
jgi:hypothetical protein